ncbi:MAG TPA: phosphate ABC transporter permease PstA [Acidimicrobiales bacterium]|nr:phosphate ABC transporter permease PstA [Acidimicrobiales bacterium]
MTDVALPTDFVTGEDARRRREAVRTGARRRLARRRLVGKMAVGACAVALCLSLVPLVALVVYVVSRGLPALSGGFLVHTPTPEGIPGNGIGNAIVGTVIIVAVAMAVAVPVGLAAALFVVERPGRLSGALRFAADVLTGAPSIAIGVFAYAVFVVAFGYSGLAGSFALAVLMLPIMLRVDEEAMFGVPDDLWEAGLALGSPRARVVRSVVLRSALPGIVTGNLLAMARAIGETAPLIFTIFGSQFYVWRPTAPMAAMPLTIYTNATQAYPDAQRTAWGTALVLMALVVILSVAARAVAAHLNRKAR